MRIDTNRSRPGTSKEKGSGLGLIITKELISIQNGSFKIDSTAVEGITITIFLPKRNSYQI
jgi:signal transduction histidine kinase